MGAIPSQRNQNECAMTKTMNFQTLDWTEIKIYVDF
jgi:hypothetical protein